MWVTKGRVWYSEEDMQKIINFCYDVIDECRTGNIKMTDTLFAQGLLAAQILELIKEIKE